MHLYQNWLPTSMVLKETMRVITPVPFVARKATADITLPK